jgi:hypothetical protein
MIRTDLRCGDCGAPMQFVERKGKRQYPHYACTADGCEGNVTAHRKTKAPMGVPADRETRRQRALAHQAFDWMWRSGTMTRKEAYQWLAQRMRMAYPGGGCHIGDMTEAEARRVIEVVAQYQLEVFGCREKVPAVPQGHRGA